MSAAAAARGRNSEDLRNGDARVRVVRRLQVVRVEHAVVLAGALVRPASGECLLGAVARCVLPAAGSDVDGAEVCERDGERGGGLVAAQLNRAHPVPEGMFASARLGMRRRRPRVLCCRSYGGRFACVATAQKGSPSAPLALLKSFADPLPSCSGWRSGECCCSRRPQGMGHSSRGRESPPAVMGGTIFTPASALFAQNSRSGAAIPCSNGMPPTALRCTE